jgi:ubiquinone/menaquinone biosynthesis C-methylase UbiE
MEQNWPLLLFNKSVLKQRKLKEIIELIGETDCLHCLDIGSDNGVISYLLRERGGAWKSADLDEQATHSIRELVKHDVFQINGRQTPFEDNEFDRVVIVDFLEHIETDREFIDELFRIIKPGGELIVNVPHIKNSLLRKFRLAIGQTDEKHGHVRPGYEVDELTALLMGKFKIISDKSYSKFFSECIDTLMTFALDLLKRGETKSQKGRIVTKQDMQRYQKIFRVYSLIYPVVWLLGKLDTVLFWRSGYMLIIKAKSNKDQTWIDVQQIASSVVEEMKYCA